MKTFDILKNIFWGFQAVNQTFFVCNSPTVGPTPPQVNRLLIQCQAMMNFEQPDYRHAYDLATEALKLTDATQTFKGYINAQRFRAHTLRGLGEWQRAYDIYRDIETYKGKRAELDRVMRICVTELQKLGEEIIIRGRTGHG